MAIYAAASVSIYGYCPCNISLVFTLQFICANIGKIRATIKYFTMPKPVEVRACFPYQQKVVAIFLFFLWIERSGEKCIGFFGRFGIPTL